MMAAKRAYEWVAVQGATGAVVTESVSGMMTAVAFEQYQSRG